MAEKRKKGYAVLGLGNFGMSVISNLVELDAEVLAVDVNEARVHDAASIATTAVTADVTDRVALETLGLNNFDAVIIGMAENLEASVMATILAKEMGVPWVIAKAETDLHRKILEKVGADQVVFPEKEMGAKIARILVVGGFIDLIELSNNVSIVEIHILKDWIGKTLIELDLRKKFGLNVIALKNEGELMMNPDPNLPLTEDETMVLTGDNKVLRRLVSRYGK